LHCAVAPAGAAPLELFAAPEALMVVGAVALLALPGGDTVEGGGVAAGALAFAGAVAAGAELEADPEPVLLAALFCTPP
jgi:hypothetical protein